jgi:hypothetical protein
VVIFGRASSWHLLVSMVTDVSARAVIAGLVTLVLVIAGTAGGGVGGGLTMLGLCVLVLGVVGVARGRIAMLGVGSRRGGAFVLVTGLVVICVGAALTPVPAEPTARPASAALSASSPEASASPTSSGTPTSVVSTVTTAGSTSSTGTALAALAALEVKGRGSKAGYDRELFGQAWFDADRNGCDTRNDVLRRDLAARTLKNDCKVLAGTLFDPYTASTIRFVYGGASEVDIDHVVAVSDAWQKGAARWTAGKRLAFANDPLNLLAVDAHTNRSKGDGDTATWLPPNKAFRCSYVARQVAVKLKYQVSVTTAEKSAMQRVLGGCPTLALPSRGTAPTVAALPRSSRTSAPATTRATSRTTKPASDADVRAGVHPGSFCAPAGALGRTTSGTLMRCRTSATDTRNRWRRA